jgi:hypothetical protein
VKAKKDREMEKKRKRLLKQSSDDDEDDEDDDETWRWPSDGTVSPLHEEEAIGSIPTSD